MSAPSENEFPNCANCDCLCHEGVHIYCIKNPEQGEEVWCSTCWNDLREEMEADGWVDQNGECGVCGGNYPHEGAAPHVMAGECDKCWQNVCFGCSHYDEEEGIRVCAECDKEPGAEAAEK
jgi:hypothetical protein